MVPLLILALPLSIISTPSAVDVPQSSSISARAIDFKILTSSRLF